MANMEQQKPEPLYIKVPPALKDALKDIAERKGETLSTVSRLALNEYVEKELTGGEPDGTQSAYHIS